MLLRAITLKAERERITASGEVELVQGGRRLRADRLVYRRDTGQVEASGEVTLREGDDLLRCRRMVVNLRTQRGTVWDGDLFLAREHLHVRGKRLERLGPGCYRIVEGRVTTCDATPPPWEFRARQLELTPEGRGVVRHGTFRVLGVPVVYVPYFSYPARQERKSGLLFPRFGSSSTEGFRLKEGLYLAPAPNYDATLWVDHRGRRGTGVALEGRWLWGEGRKGKLYAYYIEESADYRYQRRLDRERRRWSLEYEGEHRFSETCFLRATANLSSDRQFYGDYGERWGERCQESALTAAFLSKRWEMAALCLEARRLEDLRREDDTTLQRLPRLRVDWALPGGWALLEMRGAYDRLWRREGPRGHRLLLEPTLGMRRGWLECSVRLRTRSYVGEGSSEAAVVPEVRARLGLPLERALGGWTHVVEPSLAWSYVPPVDQDDLPYFDPKDRVSRRSVLVVALRNDFLLGEDRRLRADLAYCWRLVDPRRSYLKALEEPFVPVSGWMARLEADLPWCSLRARAYHELSEGRLRRAVGARATVRDPWGDSAWAEYRYVRGTVEGINGGMSLRLPFNLRLSYAQRYSLLRDESLESTWTLSFRPQCWGVDLRLRHLPARRGRRGEDSISVVLVLQGLGAISGP